MSNDPILKLEEALHKFWQDYGRSGVINGAHTEIKIVPRFFLNGKLNPEVEDLLLSVFLSHMTREDVRKGRLELRGDIMKVKDRYGNLIADIRNEAMIRETASRLGI